MLFKQQHDHQRQKLLLLILLGRFLSLIRTAEAIRSQMDYDYNNIDKYSKLAGETYAERQSSLAKRSVAIPWIRILTNTEIRAIQTGWTSYGEKCNRSKHAEAENHFLRHYDTREVVESFLSGSRADKSGVCDFTAGQYCSGLFSNTCQCRLRSVHINGQCEILEGGFDCDKNWYDQAFIDISGKDSRAGILKSWACVSGSTCTEMPELRPQGDQVQKIFVCKPNTPGAFPETRTWFKRLTEKVGQDLRFLPRGNSCKVHLNTHYTVSPHVFTKEHFMKNFDSGSREASHRCNLLKHEECDRVGKECVCNYGFGLEDGECRLSGSSQLDEAGIRRCEWELWPCYVASSKLLTLENYVPDKMEIKCLRNASCRLSTDGTFRSCQCDPGRVCPLPDRKSFKKNNGAGKRISIILGLPFLIVYYYFVH